MRANEVPFGCLLDAGVLICRTKKKNQSQPQHVFPCCHRDYEDTSSSRAVTPTRLRPRTCSCRRLPHCRRDASWPPGFLLQSRRSPVLGSIVFPCCHPDETTTPDLLMQMCPAAATETTTPDLLMQMCRPYIARDCSFGGVPILRLLPRLLPPHPLVDLRVQKENGKEENKNRMTKMMTYSSHGLNQNDDE